MCVCVVVSVILWPRPRHTHRPLCQSSLWDEEFHACCCRVTSSRPLPTQPSTKYTHTRSNRLMRRVFKIFPQINPLFIEGRRKGENSLKRTEWLGAFEREIKREAERVIQPASPGKRTAQSVQNWPSSVVQIIIQPLGDWSDAYLDKHAESATQHMAKYSNTSMQYMCKHTRMWHPKQSTQKCWDSATWQEKNAMTHMQRNRQANDNKSATNTEAQVVVFQHVLNWHAHTDGHTHIQAVAADVIILNWPHWLKG